MRAEDLRHSLQYPGEKKALTVSIIILVLLILGVSLASFGIVLVVLLLVFLWTKARQGSLLGNAILVSPSNFKAVDSVVEESCAILREERPRVHILQDPYLNAFAIGFSRPFSMVINSATLKALNTRELAFIIGHELGHIKFGHTIWLSIISPLGQQNTWFQLFFKIWQRKAEYTCDRAGLLTCRDLDSAISALIKVSSGQENLDQIDVAKFIEQMKGTDGISRAGELLGTHPYVTNRITQLLSFSDSAEYRALVEPLAQVATIAPPTQDSDEPTKTSTLSTQVEAGTPQDLATSSSSYGAVPEEEAETESPSGGLSEDELTKLRLLAGPDAINYSTSEEEAWRCVCGHTNSFAVTTCQQCNRERLFVLRDCYTQKTVEKALAKPTGEANPWLTRIRIPILKPWQLTTIMVSLALFVILIVQLTTTSRADLRRFIRNDQSERVISYIMDRMQADGHRTEVEYAIALLAETKSADNRDSLVSIIAHQKLTADLLSSTLTSFTENGLSIGDLDMTVEMYLRYRQYSTVSEQFYSFFNSFASEDVAAAFTARVLSTYEDAGATEAMDVADALASVPTGPQSRMENASETLGQIKQLGSDLAIVESDKAELEEKVSAQQSLLATIPESLDLAFRVVQRVDEHSYEVILYRWGGPYVGFILSTTHAILETTGTTYSSKVNDTLEVVRLADREVSLKETAGSFIQTWPAYQESSVDQTARREREGATLTQLQSELDQCEQETATIEQRIAKLESSLVKALSSKDANAGHVLSLNMFVDDLTNVPDGFQPIWASQQITYTNAWSDPAAKHSFIVGTTSITAPVGHIVIEGLANVFEGTVTYQLLDTKGELVDSGYTNTHSMGWGYFMIDVPNGGYGSIVIFDDAMTEGDGSEIVDMVTIHM